ncbi:MAG: homoserine kinase [Gammaproteobacteria bacterium]
MSTQAAFAIATAPACVGNLSVGFDFLGHSIEGPIDQATVTRTPAPAVRITAIRGIQADIPYEAARNTAGVALQSLCRRLKLTFGFALELDKGIPYASGMGGSAASCVAALVAANALLAAPASPELLYQCALDGESLASGARNGDNVAPQLYGGLVIGTPERVVRVAVPAALCCVLLHPELELRTLAARECLRAPFALAPVVAQTSNLALLITGCLQDNFELIRAGLADRLIEPRRAGLIPGFPAVKRAALESGALGAGISGAGPSVFAWFANQELAKRAAPAMQATWASLGTASQAWVSPVAGPKARVVEIG